VIIDLVGKGGRILTVAVPIWVKQGIDSWTTAAKIEKAGCCARTQSAARSREISWATGRSGQWSSNRRKRLDRAIGSPRFARTFAKLRRKSGGDLEQIKFLLGHSSIQTTQRYLGSEQEIAIAVNNSLGL
jgi:integrase